MVNRMRPILDMIIQPNQGAFIPQRVIDDNVLFAHAVMNKLKHRKGKKGYVALKLDMKKVYDRVEWDFICKCLQEMGFHHRWISWVYERISTVSYSIIVNDETSVFLSLLDVYVKEIPYPLSLYHMHGCPCSKNVCCISSTPFRDWGKNCPFGQKIPCLLFTYDSLLFCKATYASCLPNSEGYSRFVL